MATLTVDNPTDDLQDWVREHGQVPEDLSRRVDLNDDGSITLHAFVRASNGKPMIVNDEVATEPVTIIPARPIPLAVDGL